MNTADILTPLVLVIVSGLTGAVGVELIRTWRDKSRLDVAWFYPTWRAEMEDLQAELENLKELIVALSDELTEMGGDPMRVRVTIERQQRQQRQRERLRRDGNGD